MTLMAKPSAHAGFKALEKEWNQKLKESGFKDIELDLSYDRILKKSGTETRYERMNPVKREAKEYYYQSLEQKVNRTPLRNQLSFRFIKKPKVKSAFKSELEFQILTYYARGYSQSSIQKRLHLEGHRCKVYYPLYRWLKTWGLKQ